jgi:ribosomal-protein-alanine N-acetyltransferase
MRIETERLVLRDFVIEDWPAVFDYQREPRYLQYYPWTDRSEAEVQSFVQMQIDCQDVEPRRKFQLAITLPDSGKLIGNCGMRRKDNSYLAGAADANEHEADIGYELSPDYWGNGYATEGARAMVDFGFREFGLQRISAWCNADNVRSAGVLERAGMQLEGRLRKSDFFKDRWWDTLLYAILREEWQPDR